MVSCIVARSYYGKQVNVHLKDESVYVNVRIEEAPLEGRCRCVTLIGPFGPITTIRLSRIAYFDDLLLGYGTDFWI